MFPIQIETELRLGLLDPAHSKELYTLVDKNREHLRKWLTWIDDTKSEEDTRNFIIQAINQHSDNLGFHIAIIYRDNIVGVSGYLPLNKKDRIGEIGYWLDAEHEGLGIITKSVAKIIEIGFDFLHLNRIVIRCATENYKSRAVAERLGFVQEGVLRENEWIYDHFVDHFVYSKLKSEYGR